MFPRCKSQRGVTSRVCGPSSSGPGPRGLRNQLIIYYTPFVKYVAGRVLAGLPRHFDEEDLVSYGIIGLIDAIERFELDRNLRFETYAIPRIKGAIIDELRSIDWVPRSVQDQGAGRRAGRHAPGVDPAPDARTTPRSPPSWRCPSASSTRRCARSRPSA